MSPSIESAVDIRNPVFSAVVAGFFTSDTSNLRIVFPATCEEIAPLTISMSFWN
jgi:hypothetical protein